jgi:hypothetical protein
MKYSVITKNGEVSDISLIQIKRGQRQVDPILTLQYIDTRLNSLRAEVDRKQTEISELENIRTEMVPFVTAVELKKPEPIKEEPIREIL